MHWGRKQRRNAGSPRRDAAIHPITLIGVLITLLFFIQTMRGLPQAGSFSPAQSAYAAAAWQEGHRSLSELLGIDAYFPPQTVLTSANENGWSYPVRKWSFGEYMRSALRAMMGELP